MYPVPVSKLLRNSPGGATRLSPGCSAQHEILGSAPNLTQPRQGRLNFRLVQIRFENASVQLSLFMAPSPPPCHPERSRGICSSADLSWKIACVTSYRVEARRAVTRHQPSPEGLGHRREADPSAVGAALFPPHQPDLGIDHRGTTLSNKLNSSPSTIPLPWTALSELSPGRQSWVDGYKGSTLRQVAVTVTEL
jgi:hypothetical protein